MTKARKFLNLIEDDSAHMLDGSKTFEISTNDYFYDLPDQNQLGDEDGEKEREDNLYYSGN